MERYRIAPQCDSQSLAVHFARFVDADGRNSAQIEMALPVDECLVDLRNKFTIREQRACPQFVAPFHLDYLACCFRTRETFRRDALKYLVRFFSSLLNCSQQELGPLSMDGTGTTFRPGVGNPPGNAGGHRRGPA